MGQLCGHKIREVNSRRPTPVIGAARRRKADVEYGFVGLRLCGPEPHNAQLHSVQWRFAEVSAAGRLHQRTELFA